MPFQALTNPLGVSGVSQGVWRGDKHLTQEPSAKGKLQREDERFA